MKKIYPHFIILTGLFALLGLGHTSFAQEWKAITSKTAAAAKVELLRSTGSSNTVHVTIPGFSLEQVTVQGREEAIVRLAGAQPLQASGAPDLVSVSASFLIPATAKMGFSVISSKFIDYQDISIAPSQGERMRTTNPSAIDYAYGAAYSRDEFFPGNMVSLNRPYIVRDYRGQSANIFPFQYNPLSRTLRVYYDITISIEQTGNQGENPMPAKLVPQATDPEFQQVYNKLFLNQPQTKYAQVSENGRMLIIAYGEFIPAMKSFVEWKNTSGIPAEIVDVASIGDANSIKQYVSDYYYTKGLTYLLLVGDDKQVPTVAVTEGFSDNSYAYVAGDDHYPDFFVGRFSAENEAQVKIQAERTINYEKYPDPSAKWYENATGIGSELGPGDDGEYDFQHISKMMDDLLKYNYTETSEMFDGNQGGADIAGNPDAKMLVDNINSGIGLMLYTGHGSSSLWSTTQFSRADVADLQNVGMYPFIWSVTCGNGNFVNGTCLAEDLLRASYKGQPTGAIAALMSSGAQSWYPPMDAQDEMVDLLSESKTGNIKRTFGGISMSGCMKMMDTYGIGANKVTDTWTIFGDPSVMLRTATPTAMVVNHSAVIGFGARVFTVSINSTDAQATLSLDGQILGSAKSENGIATINLGAPAEGTKMLLCVTGYNRIPYLTEINVIKEPVAVCATLPANHHRMISPKTDFSWTPGTGGAPQNYIFFLGTDNPPSNLVNGIVIADTFCIPTLDLAYNTDYFWRVDAVNGDGTARGIVNTFRTAYRPDEDFETSKFPRSNWTTAGDEDWQIDLMTSYNNSQSSRSGNIGDGSYSSLLFNCNVTSCDFVRFWKKVSSEQGGDKLQFLLDGVVVGSWSGNIEWSSQSYPVDPGQHILEWRYAKNESVSQGEDCAWIDDIYLPVHQEVMAFVAPNAETCQGYPFTTGGIADNFSSLQWTTTGDGKFSDPGLESPTYIPGAADYASGTVQLSMMVQGNPLCNPLQRNLNLTILESPQISLPADTTLDITQTLMLDAEVAGNNTYLWLPGGENTPQLSIDSTGIGIGTKSFTVQVTGPNGCIRESTIAVTFMIQDELRESSTDLFTIYPNPAKAQINLASISADLHIQRVSISNAYGAQVYLSGPCTLPSSATLGIAIDDLPDGFYVVTVESQEGISTRKLLING